MPKMLDLFCGAGGAGVGLYRAGWDVVGVDISPQPSYPFTFIQGDALTASLDGFDAVWASPPCQAYSRTQRIHGYSYPELIAPIREKLVASGLPYVIENVPGAPLMLPITLCGEMFGLRVIRHRLFESNMPLIQPEHRPHQGGTGAHRGYSSFAAGYYISVAGHNFSAEDGKAAMGIAWMRNRHELAESIPPAYGEYIGRQLRDGLGIGWRTRRAG